jgi:hypothetical protein
MSRLNRIAGNRRADLAAHFEIRTEGEQIQQHLRTWARGEPRRTKLISGVA